MATQTVDSHQTTTSDEETENLSSESVKVAEQINLSSPQGTVEDDREKGRSDNLLIPDSTLSTSKEKAVAIQVEHPVREIEKIDETLVVTLPVQDNVQLEKEATTVSEVATVAAGNETLHEVSPSVESVEGEATELPVIAYLEKSIKEFDATDNGKSQLEEQPIVEVIKRDTLKVTTEATAQKVEQPSEVDDLPKVQDELSSYIVYSEEKEEPDAHVHFVPEVAEKVEMISQNVEEKKPEIIDSTILSVETHSSKGPTDAEEEPVTECVSVEKETDKKPEANVPKEPAEQPKKETQAIEVVPLEEVIERGAKENAERLEPPTEKEQPVELHPFKGLEEVIHQGSEIEAGQESREVIETKISESVEVHPAQEQVLIEEKINKSFEPPKNKEQLDEVISQKESVEVPAKKVGALATNEQVDEGFSVKEKETDDSTLGFEVEKQEKEIIEVKDDIKELPEITKHVQDTYAEAETGINEKPLAPRDDIGLPIEGKIQKEDGSDEQNPVCQMTESGPTEDSVKGPEKEQPATEFVSIKKETGLTPGTICVLEESVEPPKKEEQPIKVAPMKEPAQEFAKEDTETAEPPIEKEQPEEVANEISEDTDKVEPPIEKKQSVEVAKEIIEVVTKEVTQKVEPPKEKQQLEEIAKEVSEAGVKEVMGTLEPPTEKVPVETEKEKSASIEPFENKEEPNEVISREESVEVIAQEVCASLDPPTNSEQADEGFLVSESDKRLDENHLTKEFVSVNKEPGEKPETTSVPDIIVETPKKEVHPIEVPTVEEQAEVITKENFVITEPPTDKEQPIEVHPLKESDEATKIKITKPAESPKKDDNDVHPVQESRGETTDKICEIAEIPKESELVTEVHLVKELEVVSEDTTDSTEPPKNKDRPDEVLYHKEPLEVKEKETSASFEPPENKERADEGLSQAESLDVIAKEISASSESPKNKERPDEGFLLTESGEMKGKVTSDSTMTSVEVAKHEPRIIEEKDSVGELPELIKHVQNTCVEAETVKDEKELALEDDINPPTKGGKVQEEESQCVVESDEQVSVGQVAKSGLMDDSGKGLEKEQLETTCVPELSIEPPKKEELVGNDSTPPVGVGQIHKEGEQWTEKSDKQDSVYHGDQRQPSVELATPNFPHDAKEDERKELSNIDVIPQFSVVEAPPMEKVGEENEEKGVKTEKADEETHENIQKEVAPRDYEADAVVAGKSIDDQKAGDVVDQIAETKVEESITDEKLAPVEPANAQVNETPKEPQEFESKVKDEETVKGREEIPKVNDKKEVLSKPTHKHSHNILSKVKQSLVKAKKAIIGKSPSSKTLSSEARDDIKVK